jgi:hypothetical protein
MRIEGTQLCSREVEVEAEAEGECLERCANRSSVEGAILLVVAHHERRAVRGNQPINQPTNNRRPFCARLTTSGLVCSESSDRKPPCSAVLFAGGTAGIGAASPYNVSVRNPSDPLGIFAKTGGGMRGR